MNFSNKYILSDLQCPPCTDDRGGCADSNMQCITGARMCMCIEGYILDKSGQLCIPHTEGGSVTDIDCVSEADCSLIPYSTCNTRLGMLYLALRRVPDSFDVSSVRTAVVLQLFLTVGDSVEFITRQFYYDI